MPTYATPDELGEFLAPDPAPTGPAAERLLVRASRDVRRAARSARYDVDEEGLPTNTVILAAFREATLEQAAYRIGIGEDDGIPTGAGPVTSASIVNVSVQHAGPGTSGGGTATIGGVAVQAWQALADAGLTGHGPRVGYC